MPEQSIISVISLSSSPLIQRTCVSLNVCLIGGRGGCQSRPFHAFISMEGVASMKQHQNMFFHALLETASFTLRLPMGCDQTQEADFGGTRVSHSQKSSINPTHPTLTTIIHNLLECKVNIIIKAFSQLIRVGLLECKVPCLNGINHIRMYKF
ncbi:hypothetical protein AMTRI_Chr10g1970 [Amborella trichopoda]